MTDFEKLGLFYLGARVEDGGESTERDLVLYDAKHLTRHAVVVGMTGSGKTGLCIDLLEEAAIDGVPVIAIDPKGDIANLLLAFPDLAPSDFAPWIDPGEAAQHGKSEAEYAEDVAARARAGLERWGMDGARIARLKSAADFTVYTPGSSSGVPLSILKSLSAPRPELRADPELVQERISATVSGLLGLVGIDVDARQSREHILLSAIVDHSFRQGRDVSVAELVHAVQSPPLAKVGVLDLETFYPAKERFELVLALNNLLGSPGYAAWMQGEPLDVASLLFTKEGRSRVSILSIAHLGDAERMFFVTLLLNQVLAWVRTQSGTSSLRAILYMDEIFGYFPPVANPPSKKPLLTLLKQARAFGLGVVLATQNPVDLDYKGLSNTGTWFIGRLQTERDKARVIEGLSGADAGGRLDRAGLERILSGLEQRRFLMNDVQDDGPVVIESRFAMSYLRGPLTRVEIKKLAEAKRAEQGASASAVVPASPAPSLPAGVPAPQPVAESASAAAAVTAAPAAPPAPRAPALPPGVAQYFLPMRRACPAGQAYYAPVLLGLARVGFSDAKAGVESTTQVVVVTPVVDEPVPVDWQRAVPAVVATDELLKEPEAGASFFDLAASVLTVKTLAGWEKEFTAHLVATSRLELLRSPSTKATSRAGETEQEFRLRLGQGAREARDEAVEKLRSKFTPKIEKLEERIQAAERAHARETAQARDAKIATAFSVGAAVLGALGGRSVVSRAGLGRASTAARRAGKISREAEDVEAAEEKVETLVEARKALEAELAEELAAIETATSATEPLEPYFVKTRKAAVDVQLVTFAWVPGVLHPSGVFEALC